MNRRGFFRAATGASIAAAVAPLVAEAEFACDLEPAILEPITATEILERGEAVNVAFRESFSLAPGCQWLYIASTGTPDRPGGQMDWADLYEDDPRKDPARLARCREMATKAFERMKARAK